MFGILNDALRIATRSDARSEGDSRTARPTPEHSAQHPRIGLRPGESWGHRDTRQGHAR